MFNYLLNGVDTEKIGTPDALIGLSGRSYHVYLLNGVDTQKIGTLEAQIGLSGRDNCHHLLNGDGCKRDVQIELSGRPSRV